MAAYSHRQALVLHFTWTASLAAISFFYCFYFLSFFCCCFSQLLNYYYAALSTPTAKFLLEYVRYSYIPEHCWACFLFTSFRDFRRPRQIIFVANALVRGVICRGLRTTPAGIALIARLKF